MITNNLLKRLLKTAGVLSCVSTSVGYTMLKTPNALANNHFNPVLVLIQREGNTNLEVTPFTSSSPAVPVPAGSQVSYYSAGRFGSVIITRPSPRPEDFARIANTDTGVTVQIPGFEDVKEVRELTDSNGKPIVELVFKNGNVVTSRGTFLNPGDLDPNEPIDEPIIIDPDNQGDFQEEPPEDIEKWIDDILDNPWFLDFSSDIGIDDITLPSDDPFSTPLGLISISFGDSEESALFLQSTTVPESSSIPFITTFSAFCIFSALKRKKFIR